MGEIMSAGATIRLQASTDGQAPLVYEARPADGYSAGSISRNLSTWLADRPGVYCFHPGRAPYPNIVALPGVTHVRLKVTEVEPPLVGETVRVIVPGSVGIKGAYENVAWLPYALFLERFLWLTQPAWLLAVLCGLWTERRPARQRSAGLPG